MASKLGIIPAAGKAVRFGGIQKELLPISQNETLLSRTVRILKRYADEVVIITRPDKRHQEIEGSTYMNQIGNNDIWSAIETGLQIEADKYYFAMPDTFIPVDAFTESERFGLGLFITNKPERFGVFRNGKIVNKQPGPTAFAWGVLSWTKRIRDYWLSEEIADYTDAINKAIMKFGYDTWPLEFYNDVSCFEDYKAFLRKERE